ncbi:hypothetical protein ACWEPM_38295 [Streptomyces sp. NPDC004244]
MGKGRWLERTATGGNALFDRAELVDGYAVLRWQMGGEAGDIGLVHSLIDGNAAPSAVVRELRARYHDRLRDHYACVVVAQAGTQVSEPYVPKLLAYDIDTEEQYETTWRRLAAALGTPAPYWFPALRDRDAITAWRPGAPPAVVPACHVTTPVTALTELAADEPDGSAAAELCWYLAREVRRRDHENTTDNIAELRKNQDAQGDGAHLVLGAVPAEPLRPAPEEPSQVVRRAGWLAITERRDVLAHRVADFAKRWDAGHDWHTGALVPRRSSQAGRRRPTGCSTCCAGRPRADRPRTPAHSSRQPRLPNRVVKRPS